MDPRRLAPRALLAALVTAAGCSSGEAPDGPLGQATEAVDGICNKAAAATLDGFPAYPYCGNFNVYTDNGIDTQSTAAAGWTQTEGGYGYQCVEWAVRYFYFKWGVSHGWFVPYAKDMCATHPSDVSTTTSPVHGDLAVITPGCQGADATAGHVTAIDTVGATTFASVQQNPAGTVTWPKSCVSCYLHAASNHGTSDPCSTAPSGGFYCGQSTQWGGGTKDVLYDCENGVTKSMTPCPGGCNVAPAGTNDSCKPPPPPPDAGADASAPPDAGAGGDAGEGSDAGEAGDAGEVSDGGGVQGGSGGAGASGGLPRKASGCSVGEGRGTGGVAWMGVLVGVVAAVRRWRARAPAITP